MKVAFVFPGQGSQSVGMASSLEGNAAALDVLRRADAALGESLTNLMNEGPAEALNLTVNTQPAVLAVSYALYCAWRAARGVVPEMAAGHSLGEYTALTASGVLTLEDAVRLVRFRAEAMQSAVPVGMGGMAAVLGLEDDKVEEVCRAAAAAVPEGVVEPVNFNCPGQVVIAGDNAALSKACELALAAGARRALPLPVSAPFHSSLLKGAAQALATRLAITVMQAPAFDVIANVDVRAHRSAAELRDVLARQAATPVQWVKSILAMEQAGVTDIVECGPGKALTGMIRRIAPSIRTHNLCDAASLETLLEVEGMRA